MKIIYKTNLKIGFHKITFLAISEIDLMTKSLMVRYIKLPTQLPDATVKEIKPQHLIFIFFLGSLSPFAYSP